MKTIWILIQTHRGMIYEPEIFYSKEDAVKRYKKLHFNFNESYDEIEIFEKSV